VRAVKNNLEEGVEVSAEADYHKDVERLVPWKQNKEKHENEVFHNSLVIITRQHLHEIICKMIAHDPLLYWR